MVTHSRRLNNIYEINTPVYLNRLSRLHQEPITLATIPEEELARIASYGCDSVWLMGVWKRSPLATEIARHDQPLLEEIRNVLPDVTPDDILGSAYAISAYEVNEKLGGEQALIALRARLAKYSLRLILDFVPNHTAFDHEWITTHPERYIQGTSSDLAEHPSWYRQSGEAILAYGRDPHFEPWPDVAQLDAFSESYRNASIDTLRYIASLCDGVRCDMAMLMTNEVFSGTWPAYAPPMPVTEYWQDVISAIRTSHEQFIFLAECYWDMQATLIEQGFDYCYDKDLYDHLVRGDMPGAQHHMERVAAIAEHLLFFLENHDEPRAASLFDETSHLTSLRYIKSLPGCRLWHDGQFEGYRKKTPVHIGRGPEERVDESISAMYHHELQS